VSVFKVPIDRIRIGKFKVRAWQDPVGLASLRDSIRKLGDVINPIPVRLLQDGTFEALGGHRRLQAAREVGLKEVSVRVFRVGSEAEAWRIAYQEDALKEPWSPIAKATAFKRMREDGISLQDIAVIAGMSEDLVSKTLSLLSLPEDVKTLVDDGRLTLRHGLELLRLKDKPEDLMALALSAAEELWTVARLKAEVDSLLKEAQIGLISPKEGQKLVLPVKLEKGVISQKEAQIEAEPVLPKIEEIPPKEARIGEISKPVEAKPEVKPPKPRLDEVMADLRRWHYTGFIDLFDMCMPGVKPNLEAWRSGLVEFERLLCEFLEEKDLLAELKQWILKEASA
jgi:ParB/RepB/Spo0J family partition protein